MFGKAETMGVSSSFIPEYRFSVIVSRLFKETRTAFEQRSLYRLYENASFWKLAEKIRSNSTNLRELRGTISVAALLYSFLTE